ncbi:(deoxy)nucleoside triphosphate pyrophosphohydrolase [Kribbella sandramycini]|uniref:8-oxo-dGTP diphosphatase n=1 Tax=Kribbella sandramycini TaxID=60450 RepID=A0A7Y4L2J7_9ACTN|nr:(deoxy)nucleoside triphosphate pyrophosphohydrolase [Kribbella sandramycini]NOL43198.1 (deoxy)nucleoside triphosphate pyrophosphohydrolase [Kribbella sandramycini]
MRPILPDSADSFPNPVWQSRRVQSVVGVAIVRDGRVLAAYRTAPEPGWEFPGGKVEPGETEADAAVREIREELDLEIAVGASLGPGVDISDKYRLFVRRATIVSGEPVRREHAELRWFTPAELDETAWLAPDRPFVRALREIL